MTPEDVDLAVAQFPGTNVPRNGITEEYKTYVHRMGLWAYRFGPLLLEAAARPCYTPDLTPRGLFMSAIAAELDRAYLKHGRARWGRHEFYGILLEEVDEVWDAIKANHPDKRLFEEIVQVAAMCFRYVETEGKDSDE